MPALAVNAQQAAFWRHHSTSSESFAPTIAERLAENRHLKWVEVSRRGFLVLDVDRARVHGTFHHLDDAHLIVPEPTDLAVAAEVEVRRGTPRLIKL